MEAFSRSLIRPLTSLLAGPVSRCYTDSVAAILKCRAGRAVRRRSRGVRPRRGVRVAEGARLESVFTSNRDVGSNPTLSASQFLARNAGVGAWLHGVGFGEVMQAINAVSGMVEHHEDRTRAVFRPRVQGEVIGAAISLEQPILELVHCCLCSGVGGSRNHRDGSHNDAHKYDRRTNSEYLESAKPGNVKYPAHKHCEGYNQKNNPPLYALPHLANPFDQAG